MVEQYDYLQISPACDVGESYHNIEVKYRMYLNNYSTDSDGSGYQYRKWDECMAQERAYTWEKWDQT